MSKQSVRFNRYLKKEPKWKGLLYYLNDLDAEPIVHSDGITIYDVMGWKKQFDEWPIHTITTTKKHSDNKWID